MNRKHLFALMAASGLSLSGILLINHFGETPSMVSPLAATDDSCTWNHYQEVAPTNEEAGCREYWVCCEHHEHQFHAPATGTIIDAGAPSRAFIKSLEESDDRYLAPFTLEKLSFTLYKTHYYVKCVNTTISGNVSIPSVYNDLPVDGINNDGFQNCTNITSVYFAGNNLTALSSNAFRYCSNLARVILPNSVQTMNQFAFGNCFKLEELDTPSSLVSLYNNVFYNCSSLKRFNLPSTLTSIPNALFYGCSSLEEISIPSGILQIGNGAFAYCSNLTSIFIPDTVQSIGSSAFSSCTGLTSIDIPDSVTYFEQSVFNECYNLESVSLPQNITTIQSTLFYRCTNLKSIKIPSGVTKINNGAFSGCSRLATIILPDSLTNIYSGAFRSCSSLAQVFYEGNASSWTESPSLAKIMTHYLAQRKNSSRK